MEPAAISAVPTFYRGRLAPSPTGYLHLGHARTFWIAQQRAQAHGGALIFRDEDLDPQRRQSVFVSALAEDLRWFGFQWQEGPDVGGPFGPYRQSERLNWYQAAFDKLRAGRFIYPCTCSRRDVRSALQAPHQGDEEPIYPGFCRPKAAILAQNRDPATPGLEPGLNTALVAGDKSQPRHTKANPKTSWRFQVPDGETISFTDGFYGPRQFLAGKDFGDFVVWRHDGVPAYQLAVVVDDAAMRMTEVVRGADLLLSTARQLLLYRALGLVPPAFYHCPLATDEKGVRLAKRHDALSLRALRAQGATPESLRARPGFLVNQGSHCPR